MLTSDIAAPSAPAGITLRGARYAGLILLVGIAGYLVRWAGHTLLTGDASFMGYANGLCIYDCQWYVDMAQRGYDLVPRNAAGNANWAFFPMTGGSLWVLNHLTGLPYSVCGQILGEAATLITIWIARPVFTQQGQHLLFSFFLLAGPFGYAYATGLSEPLFMLFTVGVFAALRRRSFLLAAGFGFLAGLTRVTGVLIAIPVAVLVLQLVLQRNWTALSRRDMAGLGLALVAPVLATGCFMLFLWRHIGDPLAFVHVQASWGRALGDPVSTIASALVAFGSNKSAMAVFGVLSLALAVVMLVRRQIGMGLFSLAVLLVSASTSVLSLPRFFAGVSPNSIIAAQALGRGPVGFWISIALGLLIGLAGAMAWMGGAQILA